MAFIDFPYISDPTPLAIVAIFDKYLPEDWHDWEPETLRTEIPGIMSPNTASTVFATTAVVHQARDDDKTAVPWEEPDVFGDITVAFQGLQHDPAFWQRPQLDEIWYAQKVLAEIDPNLKISDDVVAYIAACLIDQGMLVHPFSTRIMDKMHELIKEIALSKRIAETWNNTQRRKQIIKHPSLEPIAVQVLKLEAARQLVEQRISLGKRQIAFVNGSA